MTDEQIVAIMAAIIDAGWRNVTRTPVGLGDVVARAVGVLEEVRAQAERRTVGGG